AVFIILAIFAAAVSPAYLARRMVPAGEYYAIICFSTVGAMTIALSADLITLFIGLETMTIPIYVLAGIQRSDRFANEAALKYFLLGAFSSALLLYGFAWLYGVAHATDFVTIAGVLTSQGIANTGYILAAVAAAKAGPSAGAAVLFYVFAYGLMNLGAFACLLYMDLEGTRGATLDELNGFARRQPLGALAFAVFLVSLTGIPPTIGFVAKFVVIQPVLDAGMAWLAVVIALNAVLAAFYYLRVVVHMYMYEPEGKVPRLIPGRGLSISLGLASLAVVV